MIIISSEDQTVTTSNYRMCLALAGPVGYRCRINLKPIKPINIFFELLHIMV